MGVFIFIRQFLRSGEQVYFKYCCFQGGMILVKSLTAMATEKLLLKTSGQQFLDGVDYMYRVGLSPDRLSVMETVGGKFILQFHSRCDLRPFAVRGF